MSYRCPAWANAARRERAGVDAEARLHTDTPDCPHLGAEAMTAPNDVAALVERLRAMPEKALLGGSFEADCLSAAATIAALQAEVERVKEEREAAERIIGILMSLCINVGGWISRGLSETATSALREAQADGWAQMGWKPYLAARSASRKENTP